MVAALSFVARALTCQTCLPLPTFTAARKLLLLTRGLIITLDIAPARATPAILLRWPCEQCDVRLPFRCWGQKDFLRKIRPRRALSALPVASPVG